MIRTVEMPILHREIAEFLDPRIHEAAPGTPSFALHGFRIDDREYVMDCLPTVGLMVGYRIVETGELVSALQCDKGISEEKQIFHALLFAPCAKYLATKNCVSSLPDGSYGDIECFYIIYKNSEARCWLPRCETPVIGAGNAEQRFTTEVRLNTMDGFVSYLYFDFTTRGSCGTNFFNSVCENIQRMLREDWDALAATVPAVSYDAGSEILSIPFSNVNGDYTLMDFEKKWAGVHELTSLVTSIRLVKNDIKLYNDSRFDAPEVEVVHE